MRLVTPKVEK
ncbi:hypothetical protein WJX84_002554, partial [Apatococcus fuscideae]